MKATMLALALLLGLAASGLGASAALAQGAAPGSSSWGDTGSHANR
ncbi:MAG: hypothetical protein JO118_01735 [Acetobacteraceae bacterium]|nr:hypothetical protein [Acetobacteraceae bacterium]